MIRRCAAAVLILSFLVGVVSCGKYGPPERTRAPERQAPEEAPS